MSCIVRGSGGNGNGLQDTFDWFEIPPDNIPTHSEYQFSDGDYLYYCYNLTFYKYNWKTKNCVAFKDLKYSAATFCKEYLLQKSGDTIDIYNTSDMTLFKNINIKPFMSDLSHNVSFQNNHLYSVGDTLYVIYSGYASSWGGTIGYRLLTINVLTSTLISRQVISILNDNDEIIHGDNNGLFILTSNNTLFKISYTGTTLFSIDYSPSTNRVNQLIIDDDNFFYMKSRTVYKRNIINGQQIKNSNLGKPYGKVIDSIDGNVIILYNNKINSTNDKWVNSIYTYNMLTGNTKNVLLYNTKAVTDRLIFDYISYPIAGGLAVLSGNTVGAVDNQTTNIILKITV